MVQSDTASTAPTVTLPQIVTVMSKKHQCRIDQVAQKQMEAHETILPIPRDHTAHCQAVTTVMGAMIVSATSENLDT